MKNLLVLGVGVVFSLAWSTDSTAVTKYYGGASCQTANETSPLGDRDRTGIYNTDPAGQLDIVCPIVPLDSTTLDVSDVVVDATDLSTNGRISCYVEASNVSGTLYVSSARYLCSTLGGCSSAPPTSYTGYNVISFSNPLNSGSSISGVLEYDVHCSVGPTNADHMTVHRITSQHT